MSGSRMKRLALFTNGTHNDTWQCNSYYDTLYRFLSEVCQLWYFASEKICLIYYSVLGRLVSILFQFYFSMI